MAPIDLTSELLRYDATFTEIVPIGVVPTGMRIDAHYVGTMAAGPLEGAAVRGIDYVLIRPDGTSVLDVRAVITTRAGQRIEVRANGYGQPPAGAASGAAALNLLGTAYCQTAAPELAAMNRTVFIFTGTAALEARTLSIAFRALTRELVVPNTA